MAEVPITISGVLYDKEEKTAQLVALVGTASLTGLGVGGGPIYPPSQPPRPWDPAFPTPPIHIPPTDPPMVNPPLPNNDLPGNPGYHPSHPIVLPPFVPSHPIVIPPDNPDEPPTIGIWPPLPNNDLPEPQPPDLPGGCHKLVYSVRYGWALVKLPKKNNGK